MYLAISWTDVLVSPEVKAIPEVIDENGLVTQAAVAGQEAIYENQVQKIFVEHSTESIARNLGAGVSVDYYEITANGRAEVPTLTPLQLGASAPVSVDATALMCGDKQISHHILD